MKEEDEEEVMFFPVEIQISKSGKVTGVGDNITQKQLEVIRKFLDSGQNAVGLTERTIEQIKPRWPKALPSSSDGGKIAQSIRTTLKNNNLQGQVMVRVFKGAVYLIRVEGKS